MDDQVKNPLNIRTDGNFWLRRNWSLSYWSWSSIWNLFRLENLMFIMWGTVLGYKILMILREIFGWGYSKLELTKLIMTNYWCRKRSEEAEYLATKLVDTEKDCIFEYDNSWEMRKLRNRKYRITGSEVSSVRLPSVLCALQMLFSIHILYICFHYSDKLLVDPTTQMVPRFYAKIFHIIVGSG